MSWKHVNFYGEYTFPEIANIVDLGLLVQRWLDLQRDRDHADQAR